MPLSSVLWAVWLLLAASVALCDTEILVFRRHDVARPTCKDAQIVGRLSAFETTPLTARVESREEHVMAFKLVYPRPSDTSSSSYVSRMHEAIAKLSDRWTVRLSWPASEPAKFQLSVCKSNNKTDGDLLEVAIERNAVYAPHAASRLGDPVPFTLVLEPVYLAFVPHTAVYLLASLVTVLCIVFYLRLPAWMSRAAILDLEDEQLKKE